VRAFEGLDTGTDIPMNDTSSHPVPDLDPERWVERYGDLLYRFALLRVRDPQVAEDLVQDAFLSALQARGGFRGGASESTWLVGILKHKIVDHFRRSGREVAETDLSDEDTESLFDERGRWLRPPAEWQDDPEALLRNRQFLEILRECLDGLPETARRAFVMREVDGERSGAICKILGISSTNLYVILHRARERLRRCLEHRWFASNAPDLRTEENRRGASHEEETPPGDTS
jgi:RNA polymerase sigma-70 factor (ECF subfamily)